MTTKKGKRGFASMDPEKQRKIAAMGGRAAHLKGVAHEFSPEKASEAGKRGGAAVARDREHMARIGRKGGLAVSRDRAHMSEIGSAGGSKRWSNDAGEEGKSES